MKPTEQVELIKKETRDTFDYPCRLMTELATRFAHEIEAKGVEHWKHCPCDKANKRRIMKRFILIKLVNLLESSCKYFHWIPCWRCKLAGWSEAIDSKYNLDQWTTSPEITIHQEITIKNMNNPDSIANQITKPSKVYCDAEITDIKLRLNQIVWEMSPDHVTLKEADLRAGEMLKIIIRN